MEVKGHRLDVDADGKFEVFFKGDEESTVPQVMEVHLLKGIPIETTKEESLKLASEIQHRFRGPICGKVTQVIEGKPKDGEYRKHTAYIGNFGVDVTDFTTNDMPRVEDYLLVIFNKGGPRHMVVVIPCGLRPMVYTLVTDEQLVFPE